MLTPVRPSVSFVAIFLIIGVIVLWFLHFIALCRVFGHDAANSRLPLARLRKISIPTNQKQHILTEFEKNPKNISSQTIVASARAEVPLPHVIVFGIPVPNHFPKRTPAVMLRAKLGQLLHERLLSLPMFSCSEAELVQQQLQKAVDYPRSKDTHTYYEGYFHSLLTRDPVLSRNPRSGKDFEKPAAGDVLCSFYESFRRANKGLFEGLRSRLWASAQERQALDPQQDVCGVLATWIADGKLFGDLSVQVHFGSAIRGDELFWHNDAENSLLHLGISIRGRRTLHSKRARTESGEAEDVLEVQEAGDVYLSTSALVNHAPEYPAATWSERIVAIQARLLYTTAQLKALRAVHTEAGWASLTGILAQTLSEATLVVPTLNDIELVKEELSLTANSQHIR